MSQAVSDSVASSRLSLEPRLRELGTRIATKWWEAWRSYWFGPGFELSYAICRIAVGLIFLYALRQFPTDIAAHLDTQYPELYRPVGILYLFGPSLPPAGLFVTCQAMLAICGGLLIVGLFSRLSLLAGLFAFLCLASLESAFEFGWGHRHPPVLLTAMALLVGPTAPYSLDAWIRRWRGLPAPNLDRARTAVLLAQFLLASIFLNAAIYKLYLGNHKPFAWCYSDNMRNMLLYQHWYLRKPLSDFLQFVVSHEWAYKGMAFGNVAMQLLPIAACFLVRRPVLRLLCGVGFAMEVYGLGMVMGLWNLHWILLGVCFIDWDRLRNAISRKGRDFTTVGQVSNLPLPEKHSRLETCPTRNDAPAASATIGFWPALLWSAGMAAFIAFHLNVSFRHLDQRRYTFPITSYPMYSAIYAQRPFGEHHPFKIYESTWKVDADPPLTEAEQHNLWQRTHWAAWQPRDFHDIAMEHKARLESGTPERTVHRIALERTIFDIAAFPDQQITPTSSVLVYRYEAGQYVRLDLKTEEKDSEVYCEVISHGLKNPSYRIGYQFNFEGPIVELSGQWQGSRFCFTHPCKGKGRSFLVAWVRDETLGDAEVIMGGAILHGGSTAK